VTPIALVASSAPTASAPTASAPTAATSAASRAASISTTLPNTGGDLGAVFWAALLLALGGLLLLTRRLTGVATA
jgi:LPXTG-motif cell wall-anchored protein